MATFAKSTFNTAIYASARPTYPRKLFDYIFAYHESGRLPEIAMKRPVGKPGSWDLAVDLGCGTGQATTELNRFSRVVGVDPSAKMLDDARTYVAKKAPEINTDFVQSSAENLEFLEDGSADLIVGAQAAHWFDWGKLWPELSKKLNVGGTAAFWIYSEFRLGDFPSLTPLITEYAQGSDPRTSLGPHWQRPGRTILDRHLVDIPEPQPGLQMDGLHRVYFTGSYYEDSLPKSSTLPVIMKTTPTWAGFHDYLHTFSSLHTFKERFPEEGDIADRFWHDLIKRASDESGKQLTAEDNVTLDWPVALVLAKKE